MVTKLAETLAEGLEQRLLFEERVERVRREAEAEYGVPCTVSFHRVREGEVQPLDTILTVVIGRIEKRRQERLDGGAA